MRQIRMNRPAKGLALGAALAVGALTATTLSSGSLFPTPHGEVASLRVSSNAFRVSGGFFGAGRARWPVAPVVAPVAQAPTEMPLNGVFGANSVYDMPVAGAPVAANSAAMVQDLLGVINDRYGGTAAFNAHQYANSFYTATATTPLTNLTFDDCQGKGYTPAGLLGPGGQFTGVPIPANAQPALGTDNQLAVWDPATDQLWEFWEAAKTANGWSACWGGRIDHVSTAPGWFSGGYGASASGLAVSGGTLELSEVRAGFVGHALNIGIPDTYGWQTWSWPAQRSDGGDGSDPNAIPEGTRLRLNPDIDVDALPGLTPIARLIAKTAQTYGLIVTDTSGAVAVTGESGAADQAVTGVDPWTALEQGVPDYSILNNFPWADMQVMPQNWGEPGK
jgi:hypothetical protein